MGHSCLSISDFTTPCYSHSRCCHSIIIIVISYYTIVCKSVCINWIFTVFNSFFFVNISTCKYFYCFIPQLTLFPNLAIFLYILQNKHHISNNRSYYFSNFIKLSNSALASGVVPSNWSNNSNNSLDRKTTIETRYVSLVVFWFLFFFEVWFSKEQHTRSMIKNESAQSDAQGTKLVQEWFVNLFHISLLSVSTWHKLIV